jgi:hypothetical protein
MTSLPITVVSPMTTPAPWSMKNRLPITAPGWISIPVNSRAPCEMTRGKNGTWSLQSTWATRQDQIAQMPW